MGYINPLLDFPSAKLLLSRPLQKRLALSMLFRQIHAEADEKAHATWARHQYDNGAFWRATATYAIHVARLLCQDNPLNVKPTKPAQTRATAATVEYFNPLLNLVDAKAILDFDLEERQVLALLFDDLRTAAKLKADTSWEKRKGPMAGYWEACAKHALRIARMLRLPDPLARAVVAPSARTKDRAVSDLASWLTTSTETPNVSEPCMQAA